MRKDKVPLVSVLFVGGVTKWHILYHHNYVFIDWSHWNALFLNLPPIVNKLGKESNKIGCAVIGK